MNLKNSIEPYEGESGTGSVIPQWTSLLFQQPFNVGITLQAKQSKVTVFTPDGGLPEWSSPYPAAHTDLSYEEILALPSADAFFGEVFGALDAKVAAMNPAPPEIEVLPAAKPGSGPEPKR